MPGPGGFSLSRSADDDGSADPRAAAALAAFASGQGSEHAAMTALAGTRLLVPVVAALAAQPAGPGQAAARESGKASDMALPRLVGHDGRPAIPAFTCLESLVRWQPAARPVPAAAATVWQAAVQDSCAVVIDIAGPVPLALEGARLAALASGGPLPLPQDDPDIRDAVAAALAEHAPAARFCLRAGGAHADLLIELAVPPGLGSRQAAELAAAAGSAVMARLGGRLRRGIGIVPSRPAS